MDADLGFTHVALPVRDVDASAAFYGEYADMQVVHRRVDRDGDQEVGVVWLSDLTRPFVLVLIQGTVHHVLGGFSHLGVACASRAEVDARCARARESGIPVRGPFDHGPPVGYWALVEDPDGHNLELAHGQRVDATVSGSTVDVHDHRDERASGPGEGHREGR